MKIFMIISLSFLSCILATPPKGWPVSVDMGCNKALSSVVCSFEFTNNANEDLYLLKRDTPLEGLYSSFIAVSNDDGPLQYEGPMVYRIPPTKDEFVLLKAGESISASVQITDIFDINTDGLYTVRYSKPLQYLSVNEMGIGGRLAESEVYESVDIYLVKTHLLMKPTRPDETQEIDYTVHFQSCTSASFTGSRNNSATLDAHKRLCGGIDKAKGKVASNSLYKTWFGTYTSARATIVKDTFQKMRDGLAGNTVTYYNNGPACKSNWIAYTYKGSKTTYLCNLYYDDPTACRGTAYTKEGTLIHEWSHAFGYRDDIAYGATNCKNLAKSNPDNAVKNADSYTYFYCEAQ